ncbi:MAG: VOC family protein [Myxococcota bacterium]
MLNCVDRILIAVRDAETAAATFQALLGAEARGAGACAHLGARRTTLAAGESEIDLLEATGQGPVRDFLDARGEGLFAAGFATADYGALKARLVAKGADFTEEHGALHLAPGAARGLRAVIRPFEARSGPGPVSRIYEVTKMTADWKAEADALTDLFGLDAARFCRITSAAFGYTGSLLLFDPPSRLDRIELSEVTDPASAMGRFVTKRGETLYMCFVETDAPREIIARLARAKARWAETPGDAGHQHFFIHPASLHGVLMGVSATNVAWLWSGRPELAR